MISRTFIINVKINQVRHSVKKMLSVSFFSVFYFFFLDSTFAQSYKGNLKIVVGDVKQRFIKNQVKTKPEVDNLIKGLKLSGVNGVRISIYPDGQNPNKEMYDYFYEQAIKSNFYIFANPAQHGGAARIARSASIYTSPPKSPMNSKDIDQLILVITNFAQNYPSTWISPFNEDGRPKEALWSASDFNEVYRRLEGKLNGAQLIGACEWGIEGSLDILNKTNIISKIKVVTTHNLGFHHDKWPEIVKIARNANLPIWDSEVNYYDKKGTGTRFDKAMQVGVDGMVIYNMGSDIDLNTGQLSGGSLIMKQKYLVDNAVPENCKGQFKGQMGGEFFAKSGEYFTVPSKKIGGDRVVLFGLDGCYDAVKLEAGQRFKCVSSTFKKDPLPEKIKHCHTWGKKSSSQSALPSNGDKIHLKMNKGGYLEKSDSSKVSVKTAKSKYTTTGWVEIAHGNDVYSYKSTKNGRYLEVPYGRCEKGARIATATSNGASHQRWIKRKHGNTFSLTLKKCSNFALDYNGKEVKLWNYSSKNTNQHIRIE